MNIPLWFCIGAGLGVVIAILLCMVLGFSWSLTLIVAVIYGVVGGLASASKAKSYD